MGDTARRFARLFILLAAASLFGCEGDTGPAGPTGSQGPAGPAGPAGDPGPSGAVPVESADPQIIVEVQSVTVPAGGGAPTVEFKLSDDLTRGLKGLPAANISFILAQLSPGTGGGSSEWQAYQTRSSAGIPDAQATTESGTSGTFVDNGDGTYSYTFAQALTAYSGGPAFDETKTHRLGIEIRTNRGGFLPENIPANNAPYDFVPAGGAPMFERLIVDNDTCNACHDNLEFHGEARFDIEYCVTCHNPYSIDGDTVNEPWMGTVDMKEMIHKIHYGENLTEGYFIFGFGDRLHDYSDVEFTQDVRNCTTCHEESDPNTPQASNWQLVANRASCGSCHDDIDWANGGHPGGFTFVDDTQCLDCHGPNATINNGEVQTAEAHRLLLQERAAEFQYEVVSMTNTGPGQTPEATIRVVNPQDGSTYDINDPNGPFQLSGSRIRLDIAWTTEEIGNVDPNDDLARSATDGVPFFPIRINFQSGAVNDGSNNFTKAASEPIPTGITGSGLAALEGRAAVTVDGNLDRVPVAAGLLAFPITDMTAQERRSVVDINKCNDCHQNLALHGDNRSGNTEVCSTCHHGNATDINRRVAGSACVNELGTDDEGIDLKYMIHGIHAGQIGVCGFGNSAHPYFDVVYPGKLNNCEGCHNDDTYYPVDSSVVLATTIDAGADRSSLLDDVAISPNTAVCSGCHTDTLAAEHMKQNGGDFAAGKDETGALISSGVETCAVCHGPGGTADVKEVHGIDGFLFN